MNQRGEGEPYDKETHRHGGPRYSHPAQREGREWLCVSDLGLSRSKWQVGKGRNTHEAEEVPSGWSRTLSRKEWLERDGVWGGGWISMNGGLDLLQHPDSLTGQFQYKLSLRAATGHQAKRAFNLSFRIINRSPARSPDYIQSSATAKSSFYLLEQLVMCFWGSMKEDHPSICPQLSTAGSLNRCMPTTLTPKAEYLLFF